MGTTSEKLVYLGQTKADIRNAIIAKGVSVPTDTTFRNYATKVSEIETNQKLVDYAARVNNNGGNLENTPLLTPFIKALTTEKLALLPSGKKVGKLYAQLPISGIGDATITRNGTATYKDANGVIQTAQANVARIEDGALLLEPQATNLFSNNNQILSLGSNLTLSEKYVYNGSINAFRLNCLSASNSSTVFSLSIGQFNMSNSTNRKYDVLIKKQSDRYIQISIVFDLSSSITIAFDFDTKQNISTKDSSISYGLKELTNGWFWLSISSPNNNNGVVNSEFCRIGIAPISSLSVNYVTIIGSFNVALANFKKDTSNTNLFDTLIETNGSTVTRIADLVTIPIPSGTTSITETINGVAQTPITTFGATHTVSNGKINKVIML